VINRKNHGTVTMTSQRATGNTRTLGMTTDDRTVERYFQTANPGRPSTDSHLGAIEKPRSIVLQDGKYERLELVCHQGFCYFLRDNHFLELGHKSINYPDSRRALQVRGNGRIVWRATAYSAQRNP